MAPKKTFSHYWYSVQSKAPGSKTWVTEHGMKGLHVSQWNGDSDPWFKHVLTTVSGLKEPSLHGVYTQYLGNPAYGSFLKDMTTSDKETGYDGQFGRDWLKQQPDTSQHQLRILRYPMYTQTLTNPEGWTKEEMSTGKAEEMPIPDKLPRSPQEEAWGNGASVSAPAASETPKKPHGNRGNPTGNLGSKTAGTPRAAINRRIARQRTRAAGAAAATKTATGTGNEATAKKILKKAQTVASASATPAKKNGKGK